jgi:C-terminal processing protease CtpA/Prc
MTRLGTVSVFAALLVWIALPQDLKADATNEGPSFSEVYELIRAHLAGESGSELNRTAVLALVSALSPKVAIVTNGSASATHSGPLTTRSQIFEDNIAYIRVGRIEDGLAKAVRDIYDQLDTSNKLQGLVLDLRYAGGSDYAAAAGVADLFVKKEKPLLDWGPGVVRSKEKADAISVPVAVLVNHQTAGAGEALAGMLRETGTGLVLGNRTAGQAMIAQEFPLKSGEVLKIATAPVKLGDGSVLSVQGLKPDIGVEVSPQAERMYYSDPFWEMGNSNLLAGANASQGNGTNRTVRRTRFNEAELVRERKEGLNPEDEVEAPTNAPPEQAVVQDPALARAIDVLKGLAVVRKARS